MVKKGFLSLSLCIVTLIFGQDVDHNRTKHITKLVTEYVSYSNDYDMVYEGMYQKATSSKTSWVMPLVPTLIFIAINFKNPDFFYTPNSSSVRNRFFDSIGLGLATYICTFLIQSGLLTALLSIQHMQRYLFPKDSNILEYYKEKKERTLNKLKYYIAENKISPEEIDHIIHEELPYAYSSREHRILVDILNEIYMNSHKTC